LPLPSERELERFLTVWSVLANWCCFIFFPSEQTAKGQDMMCWDGWTNGVLSMPLPAGLGGVFGGSGSTDDGTTLILSSERLHFDLFGGYLLP